MVFEEYAGSNIECGRHWLAVEFFSLVKSDWGFFQKIPLVGWKYVAKHPEGCVWVAHPGYRDAPTHGASVSAPEVQLRLR